MYTPLANISHSYAPSAMLWGPINFIRRNKKLYRFLKFLRSIGRNGIKEITCLVFPKKVIHLHSIETEIKLAKNEIASQKDVEFPRQIKISVVVYMYNPELLPVFEMIESVRAQTYRNLELCIIDGSDYDRYNLVRLFSDYAEEEVRLKYTKLEEKLSVSESLNRGIELSTGEYVGILGQNDRLHPCALFEVMKAICGKESASAPEPDFIYTDEAVIKDNNVITLKHYKGDYAFDTLCSCNYISNFTVFSKKLIEKAGAFRTEFEGSHDYDLILRYTDAACKIRHIPKLLYFRREGGNPAESGSAEKAIAEHLKKRGISAVVEKKDNPGFYRIRYELTERPKVSIIIPNMDNVPLLRNCVSSILEKTSYDNYEIIVVENNSTRKATFAYYEKLKQQKNIKIVCWEGKGFNYSEICNFGVQCSSGKQLVFLNNDIVIITPGWIEEMLMYSQRSDVGAVGIKLLFRNGTIQHAGVVMGLGGIAGHVYLGAPRDARGYMMKLQIVQDMSAVSAACMMVKRPVFEEAGLFNPEFSDSYNDVDLCLKLRKAGYLVVWTPYAEAYHLESKTRGYNTTPFKKRLLAAETDLFRAKWEKELNAGDFYYNCNFSLTKPDYSLR